MCLNELADDDVRVEADRLRVRANVGTAEDAARPVRHVVALDCFEQRLLDLGLGGDRDQIDSLFLTPLAQPGAETLMHADTSASHYAYAHHSCWENRELPCGSSPRKEDHRAAS